MEIGSKLRDARNTSNFTQENAAELLGVSRQTISNWENNKTYPDIVSVIKMSDLYSISLDALLKEENNMSEYVSYLEESTNVVKHKRFLIKIIEIGFYLIIWSLLVALFWLSKEEDPMGYALLSFYMILPTVTIIVSIFMGLDQGWGRRRWFMTVFFGIMYMLAGYVTFDLCNTMSTGHVNAPEFMFCIAGIVISAIGMGIGTLARIIKKKIS